MDVKGEHMNKTIAIVTGASSGMGQEFVLQLDTCLKSVDEIWVIARREEKLRELSDKMKNIPIRIFSLDITKELDLAVLQAALTTECPQVRLLVNAAGVGKAGRFDEIATSDALNMVDVNCKGLIAITHTVLPYMKDKSNIIQIASASAFLPQREFAVYAATKSMVLSFSRALRKELNARNIIVTVVCPGPVDTEFLAISNVGKEPKLLKQFVTVEAAPVVRQALRDAKEGKELSIYGLPMKAVYFASKLFPHNWMF